MKRTFLLSNSGLGAGNTMIFDDPRAHGEQVTSTFGIVVKLIPVLIPEVGNLEKLTKTIQRLTADKDLMDAVATIGRIAASINKAGVKL